MQTELEIDATCTSCQHRYKTTIIRKDEQNYGDPECPNCHMHGFHTTVAIKPSSWLGIYGVNE